MMRLLARLCSPRALARRFAASERGVAAVEFAIILPVMLALYLGLVETAQGFAVKRKVTLLARTLADLTAQATTISDTERNNIIASAAQVLAPDASVSDAKGYIASVFVDDKKKVSICWSESFNGAPAPGSIALDAGLLIPNRSLVIAEVQYTFRPAAKLINASYNIVETASYRPRIVQQVVRDTGGKLKSCTVN